MSPISGSKSRELMDTPVPQDTKVKEVMLEMMEVMVTKVRKEVEEILEMIKQPAKV